MPRKKQFHPGWEPLRNEPGLELQSNEVSGPISFLNPTRAHFQPTDSNNALRKEPRNVTKDASNGDIEIGATKQRVELEHVWRSRDNRKGRHVLRIRYPEGNKDEKKKYILPRKTATLSATLRGIWRMFTYFPYWDVSWCVATIFTWGSVIWVINSFFVWLPLQDPETEFDNEVAMGGGLFWMGGGDGAQTDSWSS
jgi:hypothetical protein